MVLSPLNDMDENNEESRNINEINISVAWGHIAVKTWGEPHHKHVLMFHGVGDNAGTFDNLVPLLPRNFYYICTDFPSHGNSSHLPLSLPINSNDFLFVVKMIMDYFNKDKYIYIGHSMGGLIGFWICKIYPERFEKFISLDGSHFFTIEGKDSVNYLKVIISKQEKMLQYLLQRKGLEYTYDEIAEIVSTRRYGDEVLTKKATEPLLKRCLEPTGNGTYYYTTDLRVFFMVGPLQDINYARDLLKMHSFSCPVLMVLAKMNQRLLKDYKPTVEQLLKTENITTVFVDGKHDVHNNRPELVAPHIINFLQTNSKL
ncbi:serine hydrolase-like protein [Diabrotica undecimpunctata]|uniref:serine hydrolase-like protein n=1 Tax=Diabrotica undecimpunctata TaxID=50387 RepID=UPI003B63821A